MEILPFIADCVFEKEANGLGLLISSAGLGALVADAIKAFSIDQKKLKYQNLLLAVRYLAPHLFRW